MSKKEKDPFEGIETEDLEKEYQELTGEIKDATDRRTLVGQELGRRADKGNHASLADCVAGFHKVVRQEAKDKASVAKKVEKAVNEVMGKKAKAKAA